MGDRPALTVAASSATAVTGRRRLPAVDRCGAVFVLLSLGFGIAFALINPPLWGQDEFSHVARAFAIDHGHVRPQPFTEGNGTNYGGLVPEPARALRDLVLDNLRHATRVLDPARENALASRPIDSPLVYAGFPNSSAYSPVPYLPSVVGLRVAELVGGSLGLAVLSMRLANLLVYTAIVWLAVWSLRATRFRWLVFCVALLPMSVYDAAMVTADTLTNALAILLSALVVKAVFLRRELSRAESILLLASAVLTPLAKPTYAVLALLVLAVPRELLSVPRIAARGSVAAGIVLCGAWALLASGVDTAMQYMRPDAVLNPRTQIDAMVLHFPRFAVTAVRTVAHLGDDYLNQFVGSLGIVYLPAPLSAVLCWTLAAVLAAGHAERLAASRRQWLAVLAVVAFNVVAVFVAEWVEWSRVGAPVIEGVQGRYFIPLAVATAALVLQWVPLRFESGTIAVRRAVDISLTLLVGLALLRSIAGFYLALWH